MNTFRLTVSSYDGTIFEDNVYMLTLRGVSGDLAVMAGHIPFATSIVPCKVKIMLDDSTERYAEIQSGLLSVASDKTTLLSENFRWIGDNE